jgi:hypothetical protein
MATTIGGYYHHCLICNQAAWSGLLISPAFNDHMMDHFLYEEIEFGEIEY